MILLVAPQLVIDESGYGQKGLTEAFVFAGFIGDVQQWEDFIHYWAPIMNEQPLWTAEKLKAKRGTKDNARILRLVEAHREKWNRADTVQDSRRGFCRSRLDAIFRAGSEMARLMKKVSRGLTIPICVAFYSNLMSVLGAIREHEGVELDVIYDCNSEHRERLENAYQDFLDVKNFSRSQSDASEDAASEKR